MYIVQENNDRIYYLTSQYLWDRSPSKAYGLPAKIADNLAKFCTDNYVGVFYTIETISLDTPQPGDFFVYQGTVYLCIKGLTEIIHTLFVGVDIYGNLKCFSDQEGYLIQYVDDFNGNLKPPSTAKDF